MTRLQEAIVPVGILLHRFHELVLFARLDIKSYISEFVPYWPAVDLIRVQLHLSLEPELPRNQPSIIYERGNNSQFLCSIS